MSLDQGKDCLSYFVPGEPVVFIRKVCLVNPYIEASIGGSKAYKKALQKKQKK